MVDGPHPIIVEGVPACVCDFCGDRTFSSSTARELDRLARERPSPGRVVEVPVYDLAPIPTEVPA